MPKNKLRISLEYDCNLFWEFDKEGCITNTFRADRYFDSPDIVARINNLEDHYQSTFNRECPQNSGFSSPEEETAFKDEKEKVSEIIINELSERYDLEMLIG